MGNVAKTGNNLRNGSDFVKKKKRIFQGQKSRSIVEARVLLVKMNLVSEREIK